MQSTEVSVSWLSLLVEDHLQEVVALVQLAALLLAVLLVKLALLDLSLVALPQSALLQNLKEGRLA